MRLRPLHILLCLVAACAAGTLATPSDAGSAKLDRPTPSVRKDVVIGPSGLPVPRFVALGKSEVSARFGPGFDYPVAAVYRRRGLPLRVIAETRDDVWRRVEDPQGQRFWVHRSQLVSNASAIVTEGEGEPVLRAKPSGDAAGRARLAPGVLAEVLSCDGAWCRVKAGEVKGYLPADRLWGVERG